MVFRRCGNEPDLLWTDYSKFPTFFTRTQPLIRAACPECKIVLAGISNQYDTSSQSYQRYDGFVNEIASAKLTGRPFDVFDLHYYKEKPQAAEIHQAVQDYQKLLDKHGLAQGGLRLGRLGAGLSPLRRAISSSRIESRSAPAGTRRSRAAV